MHEDQLKLKSNKAIQQVRAKVQEVFQQKAIYRSFDLKFFSGSSIESSVVFELGVSSIHLEEIIVLDTSS